MGSSPTQNHCCWDYAVPLDTYLENTVGDGKTQQISRKAKPYQGTRFRTTPKRQQLRPQPMETTGYSLHNDRLLRRFDSPKFWGSNVELRRSQLLNTVHPPFYSKWNLSKNQTQTSGNEIQDAYGKSRSLILAKKYGTWIDPFPGLLVTTRWLADIFRLQMAPGIPKGRGLSSYFPTGHSTLPAAGHQHQRGISAERKFHTSCLKCSFAPLFWSIFCHVYKKFRKKKSLQ